TPGTASLYTETSNRPASPTTVIETHGTREDVTRHCRMAFEHEGDEVFLLGSLLEQPAASLAASEYLMEVHGLVGGRLSMDLGLEARLHRAVLALIRQRIAT